MAPLLSQLFDLRQSSDVVSALPIVSLMLMLLDVAGYTLITPQTIIVASYLVAL